MKKSLTRNTPMAYLFILPSLLAFLAFMVFPMVFSLVLGFSKWNMFGGISDMTFVGFENFIRILDDDYFSAAIRNNLVFTLIAIPALIMLAIGIAVLLNKKVLFRAPMRAMIFMPYVTTITASAAVFSVLFHPQYGPINSLLRSFGVANPPGWAVSSDWSLITVALFWIWMQLGYCVVIFLAALQGISRSYYEAATIDGANGFTRFLHITLPMISPTTFFVLITNVIGSFKIFAEVQVLTGGGPGTSSMTMVYHIYRTGFERYDMGYASAIAWVFFLVVLAITVVQWIGQKRWVNYDA